MTSKNQFSLSLPTMKNGKSPQRWATRQPIPRGPAAFFFGRWIRNLLSRVIIEQPDYQLRLALDFVVNYILDTPPGKVPHGH